MLYMIEKMMKNIEKLKSLININLIENQAIEQIEKLLQMPEVSKLVIMPDVHMGATVPIGSVILSGGYVMPLAVGSDIGCGMCYADTGLNLMDLNLTTSKKMVDLFNKIKAIIPHGMGKGHEKKQEYKQFKSNLKLFPTELEDHINVKIKQQLGSLGEGNHFIEIGVNRRGNVGVTIHSGSRNPGLTLGNYYIKEAAKSGGWLSLDSEVGKAYVADHKYMIQFAYENRKRMMFEILKILGLHASFADDMVNIHHNFIEVKNEYALHRKGATPAKYGQIGIIPGSRASGVYIVRGLGNEEYLCTTSHGAGRKMSRKKAKDTIDLSHEQSVMKNIVCDVNKNNLDEASGAYKDINKVIKMQEGIVMEVIDFVHPIINIK